MPLTDIKIRSLKPREKPYKQADEKGLYLLIKPNASKHWRFKYRFTTEKLLAFVSYPEVSLVHAREMRDEARKLLIKGVEPSIVNQATKHSDENSFEAIAREWHMKFMSQWKPEHAADILKRLEKNVFPWLGNRPIAAINSPELLSVIRRIESRGASEIARKTYRTCGQVYRYAVASGRTERNPAPGLKDALQPASKRHLASIIEPKEIGRLLRAIYDYEGSFVTQCALRLASLVFVRPGELRYAEWKEIDFEKAEWRIPAAKMKMQTQHIVPLSTQAITVLQELQPLTGNEKYVFPSVRSSQRPMSENTVNAGLRRLGYTKEEMTGHGFRSMASTLLNEQGWDHDAIERQLAHSERNSVRAAYNYAEHLPERCKMMQAWADYLDKLRLSK